MWPQDDEHDVLLIDRAAAAHVPQDSDVREWALDKRVFISSVMAELGEERAAAANGVRSLGAKPVMFEEFGGRDADPLDAYLGEVETSQIYVGILGQSYGRPLPTRFSATHTEFRHAEQQGLRMAVWALATQHREGPQQSFLDEVRVFHVVPAFRSPADLERQVAERLRGIAAEDLAPWTKLGSIVFRATKVVHVGNEISVTARVQSDDVAHALETAAPNDFGAGEEHRFTWAGRCRCVRVASVGSTTTTARSKLMQLPYDQTTPKRDSNELPDGALNQKRICRFMIAAAVDSRHTGRQEDCVHCTSQPARSQAASLTLTHRAAWIFVPSHLRWSSHCG